MDRQRVINHVDRSRHGSCLSKWKTIKELFSKTEEYYVLCKKVYKPEEDQEKIMYAALLKFEEWIYAQEDAQDCKNLKRSDQRREDNIEKLEHAEHQL